MVLQQRIEIELLYGRRVEVRQRCHRLRPAFQSLHEVRNGRQDLIPFHAITFVQWTTVDVNASHATVLMSATWFVASFVHVDEAIAELSVFPFGLERVWEGDP